MSGSSCTSYYTKERCIRKWIKGGATQQVFESLTGHDMEPSIYFILAARYGNTSIMNMVDKFRNYTPFSPDILAEALVSACTTSGNMRIIEELEEDIKAQYNVRIPYEECLLASLKSESPEVLKWLSTKDLSINVPMVSSIIVSNVLSPELYREFRQFLLRFQNVQLPDITNGLTPAAKSYSSYLEQGNKLTYSMYKNMRRYNILTKQLVEKRDDIKVAFLKLDSINLLLETNNLVPDIDLFNVALLTHRWDVARSLLSNNIASIATSVSKTFDLLLQCEDKVILKRVGMYPYHKLVNMIKSSVHVDGPKVTEDILRYLLSVTGNQCINCKTNDIATEVVMIMLEQGKASGITDLVTITDNMVRSIEDYLSHNRGKLFPYTSLIWMVRHGINKQILERSMSMYPDYMIANVMSY